MRRGPARARPGLVYGAALAGWTYLVVWGALRALDVGGAQKIGALVGVAAWVLVVVDVERIGARGGRRPPRNAR